MIGRGIGFFSLLLIDEMKWEKKKETPILVLIMLNDKFMSALSWKQTEGVQSGCAFSLLRKH